MKGNWRPPVTPPSLGIDEDEEDVPDRRSLKKAAASIVAGRRITNGIGELQTSGTNKLNSGRLSARQSTQTWNGGVLSAQKPKRRAPRMPRHSDSLEASNTDEAPKEIEGEMYNVNDHTEEFIIRISDYRFIPNNVSVRLGTVIKWEVDEDEPKMIEYSVESTEASTNERQINSEILTAGSSFKVRFVTEGSVCFRDPHNDISGKIEVQSRGILDSTKKRFEDLCKEEEAEQRLLAGIGTGLGMFSQRPQTGGAVEELEQQEEQEKIRKKKEREKERGEAIRRENNRLEEEQKRLEKDPRYRMQMQQQREQLVQDSLRIHRERREKKSDVDVLLNTRVSSPRSSDSLSSRLRIRKASGRRLSGDDIYDF